MNTQPASSIQPVTRGVPSNCLSVREAYIQSMVKHGKSFERPVIEPEIEKDPKYQLLKGAYIGIRNELMKQEIQRLISSGISRDKVALRLIDFTTSLEHPSILAMDKYKKEQTEPRSQQ